MHGAPCLGWSRGSLPESRGRLMSGLRKQAFRVAALVSCLVLLGCGSGSDHGGKDADASSAGGSAAGTGGSSGASGGAKGSSGASSNGGANGSGGAIGAGGSATDGGGIASAPPATCDAPVPLADVSSPGSVVGNGTPDSCTEQALIAAVTKGGVVTFDCGAAAHTITVTSQIDVKKDTVIDGGGKVTLSGSKRRASFTSRAPGTSRRRCSPCRTSDSRMASRPTC